ncbi:MAG: efflux RND transporter periplasmic adaptor subunit [Verrucomicrobiota bacterium]|nr:efflux RND transporter periplasmic adaptor subunit [Verrucomicrobiota bacterium]
MKKSPFPPAVAFTCGALMLTGGCSRRPPPPPDAGVPVLVATAVTTNVPVQILPPPVGHVLAYSTVTIRPQIGGILQEVHFQEGQGVQSNALLFTIDPRPSQAALAAARANLARDRAQLENARIQFARDKKLFSQKLVSQDAFDTSRADMETLAATVASDEAAVTNAALNLGFCQIRSPVDGVTGALQFHRGNVVKAPDDTLVTIVQIHPICVRFGVPERYLAEIRKQMRVRPPDVSVAFEGMDGPPPRGELTFIDNTVDPSTGEIQLRATFPNAHGTLWPGQFVRVALTLSELTNAVVVPSPAVQTGQGGEYVYVVRPNQTVEERPVTLGPAWQDDTVVRSGLKAGEKVVTDGQLRLVPGAKVSIKAPGASRLATASPATP